MFDYYYFDIYVLVGYSSGRCNDGYGQSGDRFRGLRGFHFRLETELLFSDSWKENDQFFGLTP